MTEKKEPAARPVVPTRVDAAGAARLRSSEAMFRGLQAMTLAVLDGISDAVERRADPEAAIDDALTRCLEAVGVSAILLFERTGRLGIRAFSGAPPEIWRRHARVLEHVARVGGGRLPVSDLDDASLRALDVSSLVVMPIVARDELLGVLAIAAEPATSTPLPVVGTEGESCVRAARSLAMQLGRALSLGRTFVRLAATERRYHAFFEGARDAIGVMTPGGFVLEVNRGWEEILGRPRSQIAGHLMSDFFPEGERDLRMTEYAEAVLAGGACHRIPFQCADGSIKQVEVSRTVIEIGDETLVLSVGRDVTERPTRLEPPTPLPISRVRAS